MTDDFSSTTDSSGGRKIPAVDCLTGNLNESGCSSSSSSGSAATGITAAATASRGTQRRRTSRRTLALRSGAMRWRNQWSGSNRETRMPADNSSNYSSISSCSSSSGNSPPAGSLSQSNNQGQATTESSNSPRDATRYNAAVPTDFNVSADTNQEHQAESSAESPIVDTDADQNDGNARGIDDDAQEASVGTPLDSGPDSQVFANLDGGSQTQAKAESERTAAKSELANVIEKAILDFCSSRTVETMRRMFAGATSEMEALQGEGGRQGDKSVQAPHPVTGELVKEGIVIGNMDVFAPRVHREYRLEMKDNLVEGFLKDAGVFRSICYRTKCQLEVTRRLLNKKMCTGGRWVKYLIVRIVGPSIRSITCCDQLLQKAVPAFKHRIEYPKPAFCRLFFREDIPDNALLYHCFQRTGGTSNRYGALRLETPYRATAERTVSNCPWKSGALKIGKLSFAGSGAHLSMKQVYPGYGYTTSTPVEPESQGVEAVHRIEHMHNQFLTRRQLLLQDRRVMTIPVCR